MKRLPLCLALLFALGALSCSLDPFLFNESKTDHYSLSTEIIPDSARRMVTFNSRGRTLYGFDVKPAGFRNTGYTALYCHGNKDNIQEYWNRVELFYQMGIRCFIFDYEGFGMSEGTPSISALYADGHAALRFMLDSLAVDSGRLFFYGFSLGNVVSIDLAADSAFRPYALIAEAPFASSDVLLHSATPIDLPGRFVVDSPANNAERVRQIRAPFLLLHGDRDDFVAFEPNGRLVFEHAPYPKELVLVHGANHADVPWVMGVDTYRETLLGYLNRLRPDRP